MKLTIIVFLIVFLSLFLTFYFEKEILNNKIDNSIKKAQVCLRNFYDTNYFYKDAYFNCSLPEDWQCGLSTRKSDAAIVLLWINDTSEKLIIHDQIENARKFINKLNVDWKKMEISYGYFGMPEKNNTDVGLDSYCIIASLNNDSIMINQIRKDLGNNEEWVPEMKFNQTYLKERFPYRNFTASYFQTHFDFRRIIDETWCIDALAKNENNKTLIMKLFNRKLSQSENYSNNISDYFLEAYTITHLLILYHNLGSYGYDLSQYEYRINIMESRLADISNELTGNNELANILFTLSYAKYENIRFMKSLALKISSNQDEDGCWYNIFDGHKDSAHFSFYTLHGLLSLSKFRMTYGSI